MKNVKQTAIGLSITFCLAVLSFNALAATKTTTTAAPGSGGTSANAGAGMQTLQLIEEIVPAAKGAKVTTNTYRFEPAGLSFKGPVQVCLKYIPSTRPLAENSLKTAMISMAREVKDMNGKSSYNISGPIWDDKSNSQVCVPLTSF